MSLNMRNLSFKLTILLLLRMLFSIDNQLLAIPTFLLWILHFFKEAHWDDEQAFGHKKRRSLMKNKRSTYSKTIDVLCLLILVGGILCFILYWQKIPNRIPAHYNFQGEVDRMGSKQELLVLPIINCILFLGLSAVEHFPDIWNTGVRITEENRERVYAILEHMLSNFKFIVVSIFSFITIKSMLPGNLPIWFTPAFFILIFGVLIYYLVKLNRAK